MKRISWNTDKARKLAADRNRGNVGFEDCVIAIEDGRILDIIANPVRVNQKMFVLRINDYAYVAPFVENEDGIFLKTVYPSRKHTAIYLRSERNG